MRRRFALSVFVLFTVGCSESPDNEPASADAVGSAVVAAGGSIRGMLLEQMPVEPYVYVRLETDSGEIWAAVNEAPLTVGDTVTVYNAFVMEQFASQTLNRTFEKIYFGALEPSRGAAGDATTNPEMSGGSLGMAGTPPAEDAKIAPVARAQGADARRIDELWAEREQRAGARVSIRGVVVKYNAAVMGKNWIHLQDGSGSAAQGTHDLVVTTMDAASVGDTVTITGVVRTNQDLGAGYVYALLVEEASVIAH